MAFRLYVRTSEERFRRGFLLHCSLFPVFDELNVDCFVVNVHTQHLDMGDLSKNTHYGQLLSAAVLPLWKERNNWKCLKCQMCLKVCLLSVCKSHIILQRRPV